MACAMPFFFARRRRRPAFPALCPMKYAAGAGSCGASFVYFEVIFYA